jgi:hypothetical protein
LTQDRKSGTDQATCQQKRITMKTQRTTQRFTGLACGLCLMSCTALFEAFQGIATTGAVGLCGAAVLTLSSSGPARAAGLYDDENKEVKKDELNDQDYWWAKFDAMMLELAVKQRQPEGRIGMNLATSLRRLEELAKKYPKHEEIKKWKERAEAVDAKIDPNANRGTGFNPGGPWEEANFAQLWVNLHWAQTAAKVNDYNTASSCMQNVMQNYSIMLQPDRMKNYPEDLKKWVEDNKPVADKFWKEIKAKRSR